MQSDSTAHADLWFKQTRTEPRSGLNSLFLKLTYVIIIQWEMNIVEASVEPLLFENIGQMVSGLSYVHTHIPINITELEVRLQQYNTAMMHEFSEENLQMV